MLTVIQSKQVGEVYMFKGFTVKSANKQYSTLNNDYELTLQSDSIIMPCDDGDANEVPSVCFNFVDIASIEGVENNKTVGKSCFFIRALIKQ